jgi:hypothetical protein
MARDESDDFAVAARALRLGAGREVSIWAVALVVRVEALVAIAFGFALDVIALRKDRIAIGKSQRVAYHVIVTSSRAR